MIDISFTAVVALAFIGDIVFGDPPNRLHPVAWMGNAISWVRRSVPSYAESMCFFWGVALVCIGVLIVGFIGWFIQQICLLCPVYVNVLVQALVLKCTFTISSLAKAAQSVCTAIRKADILSARQQVAYHLVSRDVSNLNASKLAAATVESVAENTSDSVIAPLFFFAFAGLPGALVYRFVNTCDAMLGYHTPELEWFGKAAARTDDLLNLLPSRVTAILMLAVGAIRTGRFRSSVRIWLRDHRLTASPNAGHPMSAAAGVLGVVLEKEGYYILGADQSSPNAKSIEQSIRMLWDTSVVGIFLLVVAVQCWEWVRG
ncbi:MAG TPA: cobalamin biosynthesis protein [Pirellula sp.]|nr:cobalamin biosynthesis protein [Pirellula sp.]